MLTFFFKRHVGFKLGSVYHESDARRGVQYTLIPFPSCFQLLHSFFLAVAQREWGEKVKFTARCLKENPSSLGSLVGVSQVWVLGRGRGLDPGRDYVFHYPNISNFSLQFGEAKSFWVPTQYLPLELIICFVKFRGILIRVIELGFSGWERGSYKQACCHSRGSLCPGPAGRLSLHTSIWSTPSWGA